MFIRIWPYHYSRHRDSLVHCISRSYVYTWYIYRTSSIYIVPILISVGTENSKFRHLNMI